MPEKTERPLRARRAKKKVCVFCVDKVENIDYKDTAKLQPKMVNIVLKI